MVCDFVTVKTLIRYLPKFHMEAIFWGLCISTVYLIDNFLALKIPCVAMLLKLQKPN